MNYTGNKITKNKKPLISVIVPVYNVEKYLSRCLDSIISQSYINLEIILINDGSVDTSGEICNRYSHLDKRITVIHQLNSGQSAARNKGLSICMGDYIGFVDSDDWIHTQFFELLLIGIHESNADWAECDCLPVDTLVPDGVITDPKFIVEDASKVLSRVLPRMQFAVWKRLYNARLFKGISFIENKISEDVFLFSDLLSRIKTTVYCDLKLYYYFQGENSVTRGNYTLKQLNTLESAKYLRKKLIELKMLPICSKEYNLFYKKVLLFNYLGLNRNPILDFNYSHRKGIKNEILGLGIRSIGTFKELIVFVLPPFIFSKISTIIGRIKQ